MPRVSVIIPTHNRPELLRVAVASVLGQTLRDLEVIVVDDASIEPGENQRVIRALRDSRIRYFLHPENRGLPATRNTALRHSAAPCVAFLDDDDEWRPSKLELQLELFDRSPASTGLVYCHHTIVDHRTDRLTRRRPQRRGRAYGALCDTNFLCVSTVALRRECLERVGLFDESLPYSADYDLWLRVAREFDLDYVDEDLVRYNVHAKQMTASSEKAILALETEIVRWREVYGPSRVRDAELLAYLGVLYCYRGDTRLGRRAFLGAIRNRPREPRNYIHFALTFLGARTFRRVKEWKARSAGEPRTARSGEQLEAD